MLTYPSKTSPMKGCSQVALNPVSPPKPTFVISFLHSGALLASLFYPVRVWPPMMRKGPHRVWDVGPSGFGVLSFRATCIFRAAGFKPRASKPSTRAPTNPEVCELFRVKLFGVKGLWFRLVLRCLPAG